MLCIIPARGGSKRIPRKNIKEFLGLPMIAYSIQAALKSGCFSEVMVSTDSEQIAEVAVKYGASVPFLRSAKTSDDFATTADVVKEVIDKYADQGKEFSTFAVVYATAPFLTPETLQKGAKLLAEKNCGSFTCVEYSYPIQRALVINDNGYIEMREPQYLSARSQDLQKTYHDAGQCYFCSVDAFLKYGSLWGPDTLPLILSNLEVQDIDTPIDWEIAEMKYRLLHPEVTSTSHQKNTCNGNNGSENNGNQPDLSNSPFRLVPYQLLSPEVSEIMRNGRNLPEIRRNMVNTQEISKSNHEEFVASLKKRSDKGYYALYVRNGDEEDLIGSITISYFKDGSVERGIWLFPEAQGYGYARASLSAIYDALQHKGVTKVYTRVRRDNDPSNSLEEYLGAVPVPASEYDSLPEELTPIDPEMIYYVLSL